MKYVMKKLSAMLLTIIIVSFLAFLAFSVISGDPALSKLGTQATPERLEALREEMGLNRPLLVRYGDWAWHFLQGDMGESYDYNIPVREMIGDKLPITITMTFMSFLFMTALAIPLGIYTAKHENSLIDQVIYIVNQVIMSIPPFFSGIIITWIFGLMLKLFTPGGFISYEEDLLGFVAYLVFPSIAIALPKCAMTVKLLRASILDEVKADYVRTAYSRGNNTGMVLYHHILKNAMIPVITFLGMALADILAGSIVMEQVFGIPGIGRILLTSINNRDYPVVQAIIVLIAVWVIGINFLVDVIYRLIDPRIED